MSDLAGILALLWLALCVTMAVYGFQAVEPKYLVGGIVGVVLVGIF